jgi:solute:Na+ symporter, SSS family
MITGVIGFYLLVVLSIGVLSNRLFRGTGEDYFVASRTIGPFLLLMSLFGTNMTAFSILGASGESYTHGIGVFGLMASSSALVIPAIFLFVGTRIWRLGQAHGYVTQAQFLRDRFQSDTVGLLAFVILTLLVIPYLLIGVMGGGITLNHITQGDIPQWVGSLVVCLVVLTYVCFGGLRGTAWANAFQTIVFMVLGTVTVYLILVDHGGLSAALSQIQKSHPLLLKREGMYDTVQFASYMLIPLSAGTFPHLFMHWLTARRRETFRWPIVLYPICIAVVWVPSVLLGVLGRLDFPDLTGPAASGVLIAMIETHAPGLLAGLLAAGVLAAVMSSLDSQVLAVGTMFTQDVVRHYGFHDLMTEHQQILCARLFVAVILLTTFVCSLVVDRSIFRLAIWSFTGFASLFPIIVASLFWRRTSASGVIAAIVTVFLMWTYFLLQSWSQPGYTVWDTGLMPVVFTVVGACLALFVGSIVSRPVSEEVVNRVLGPVERQQS